MGEARFPHKEGTVDSAVDTDQPDVRDCSVRDLRGVSKVVKQSMFDLSKVTWFDASFRPDLRQLR